MYAHVCTAAVGYLPPSRHVLQPAINQLNAKNACPEDWWLQPQHSGKCRAPFELIKAKEDMIADGTLISIRMHACPYLAKDVELVVSYTSLMTSDGSCDSKEIFRQTWADEFTESFFITIAFGTHLNVAAYAMLLPSLLEQTHSPSCMFARSWATKIVEYTQLLSPLNGFTYKVTNISDLELFRFCVSILGSTQERALGQQTEIELTLQDEDEKVWIWQHFVPSDTLLGCDSFSSLPLVDSGHKPLNEFGAYILCIAY